MIGTEWIQVTLISYMSLVARRPVFRVLTRSDTNRSVQPHKMAKGLKFQISKGLYYLCGKNKSADQLRGSNRNHAAVLRLCFRIYVKGSFKDVAHTS